MSNLMGCWDKCVSLVNPLATEDIAEGKAILTEDSFTEFLDFCKEIGYDSSIESLQFLKDDLC